MKTIFYSICFIHVLFWIFVIFAFLNKKTAYINLYYIIPCVYVIHILPFHLLISLKKKMYPNTWEKEADSFENKLFFVKAFKKLQNWFINLSTFSPISPQGMMIFGLISSLYKLYPLN